METDFKRLLLMRGVARVGRMHTIPTSRTQTVGEHTFSLLAILDYICYPDGISHNLFRGALYHDAPEFITGDTPSTAKWANADLEHQLKRSEARVELEFEIPTQMTADEKRLLKYADLLELGIFCLEEHRMGDYRMLSVCRRVISAVMRRGLERVTPNAHKLYEAFVADVLNGKNFLNGVSLHVTE